MNPNEPIGTDGPATNPRSRVLLVDDHETGRKSLARLLDALGYDVTSVADGASALQTLAASPRFDFVLTDVRLPDFDGREVVVAARQIDPRPLIGFITGWDVDPEERHQLGVDWVFLKPLDIQDIVAKLRQGPPARPTTGPA